VNVLVHQPPKIAHANGIDICYEIFGDAGAEPLLLIMGLGAQMIHWDDEFCHQLAARGFRVIRFDNRDVGLGHKHRGVIPDIRAAAKAIAEGQKPDVPYTLNDMADDGAALLDALGIQSAHVAGASMGGMIAQLMAIRHPAKVRSLISLMSTTSDPSLPRSDPRAQDALMSRPLAEDKDSVADHAVKTRLVIGSPAFPEDQAKVRARFIANYDRSYYPEGAIRQWAAVMATPPRTKALRKLNVPALVIHGDADILIHPDAGRHTAASIPGAELKIIEGWGHNMPPAAVPVIAGAMIDFMRKVEHDRTEAFARPPSPGCCGRE
jgi:pimeloyl-ACP methyl ester carboxylesterase